MLLVPVGAQKVFAEPGNTEIILDQFFNGFSELTINDPDGIAQIERVDFDLTFHGCSTNVSPFGVLVPRNIIVRDCQDPRDVTTWLITETDVTCVSGSCLPDLPPTIVGGKLIPIETTSLILAGAQSFSWMIPVVLTGIGIGLFVVSRKSE